MVVLSFLLIAVCRALSSSIQVPEIIFSGTNVTLLLMYWPLAAIWVRISVVRTWGAASVIARRSSGLLLCAFQVANHVIALFVSPPRKLALGH